MLLEGLVDTKGALQAAERAKQCLGDPFVLGPHHLPRLTASVGIAAKSPGERPSAERLLNEADTAIGHRHVSGEKIRQSASQAVPRPGGCRQGLLAAVCFV